jgi:GT2 family glycosyltransferase
VKTLHLPQNLGIPGGRNAGVPKVSGEFLFFLDDDSWLLTPTFLADCARLIRNDPTVGMIQPRIVDPARRGEEPTRWIPRIRKGDPAHSSNVFAVAETALVLPREVFEATGGWPDPFFYAHEGIELAWRVWDAGRRVVYEGGLEVGHPVVDPARHDEYLHMNARNRVWLARRCLPWPVSWLYVANWTGIQVLRWRREPDVLRVWFVGWRAGFRELPWEPGRRPNKLSWRTVFRMGRQGRPPII